MHPALPEVEWVGKQSGKGDGAGHRQRQSVRGDKLPPGDGETGGCSIQPRQLRCAAAKSSRGILVYFLSCHIYICARTPGLNYFYSRIYGRPKDLYLKHR